MKIVNHTMKIIVIIFICFGTGCIIEERTITKAFLSNRTEYKVEILFYKDGVVSPRDTIILLSGVDFLLGEAIEYGDYKIPGFSSDFFGGPDDSIVVIFNDSFRVAHYFNTPPYFAEKYYLNESLRNISNPRSYEFEMIRTKNERLNIHRYTFTDEDYEYAKD